jgi:metal-responsive CopG/Arc/MetJ family transcriptional regulator
LTFSAISLIVSIKGGIKMGRAVKINITLPEEELKEVDAFVQRQGDTRSGFIQQALRFFIEQKERDEEERKRREEMIKAISGIKQLREKSGEWDGVSEIRKWRESK